MGVMDRFERRLDRLVNGVFAKTFKAEVEPVEIASALQRECDNRAAIVSRGRTMVPNQFHVELGESDFSRLSVYAQPLSDELAAMVREHADERGYALVGPVSVDFERSDDLDTGLFRIRSEALTGVTPAGTTSSGAPPPVAARLEIAGRTVPLSRRTTVLGRGEDVDLRIDDPGVSRQHAQIVLGDPSRVVDLGSTNGTWVDGQQVAEAELFDGSRIAVGATTAIFRLGS
jgi:FhaA, N-terminal domain/FHA domain